MRLIFIGALALCTQLGGCFVFIPGAVVGKVADSLTGDSGEHCVTRATKIGDKIRDQNFNKVYTVVKVSETASSRCTNLDYPMRAEMAMEMERKQAALPPPPPKQFTGEPATAAERAAACDAMNAVKPGAAQAEFQAAYTGLRRIGMTYRDCQDKPGA